MKTIKEIKTVVLKGLSLGLGYLGKVVSFLNNNCVVQGVKTELKVITKACTNDKFIISYLGFLFYVTLIALGLCITLNVLQDNFFLEDTSWAWLQMGWSWLLGNYLYRLEDELHTTLLDHKEHIEELYKKLDVTLIDASPEPTLDVTNDSKEAKEKGIVFKQDT